MKSTEDQIYDLVMAENPDNPLSYVQNIVKPMAKAKLDSYILGCNECDICSLSTSRTITKGNPNSPIIIIGESPSIDQVEFGSLPFNSDYFYYLNESLRMLNINEDQLFYINSVNCVPYRDGSKDSLIKRSPTKKERTNCKVFLDYAIKMVEPLMIICLGGTAVNGINEEIGKQSITKIRGSMFTYRGIPVMPTFHPGYFMELREKMFHDEEYIEALESDFYGDLTAAFKYFSDNYEDINIYNEEVCNE